jgi:hypothetical protein
VRLGLPMDELVALDAAVARTLAGGPTTAGPTVDVLEGGHRRLLVALPGQHGLTRAARRVALPDAAHADRFVEVLERWRRRVEDAGVAVLPCSAQVVAPPDGGRVVWLVRPRVPDVARLPAALARCEPPARAELLSAVLDAILGITARGAGVAAAPSGWAWLDGMLVLTDLSRPELPDLPLTLRVGPLRRAWPWDPPRIRRHLDRALEPRAAVGLFLEELLESPWRELALARAAERVTPAWTGSELHRTRARSLRIQRRLVRLRREAP